MNLSAMRSLLFFLMLVIVPVSVGATQTILVLGDSISAGFGLAQGEGWVALLEQRIKRDKLDYQVVNASISGETTLGGRNRIANALEEYRPAVVVVALGGNDGLRGNPLEETRRNLIAIVEACRKKGAKVVIAGMRIPPNYGPVYTRRFESLFTEVARQQNVSLVPFMLQGFADDRNMFQADGIHPAAAAQPRILNNVYHRLRPLLLPRPRRQT
ncbi:MAG TPA: arylesterase [Burkholderiales bacterium]|nr:arylesterase [Burkholderiales bacterium]